MVLQRKLRPSSVNVQLDPRYAASKHTTAPINRTRPSPGSECGVTFKVLVSSSVMTLLQSHCSAVSRGEICCKSVAILEDLLARMYWHFVMWLTWTSDHSIGVLFLMVFAICWWFCRQQQSCWKLHKNHKHFQIQKLVRPLNGQTTVDMAVKEQFAGWYGVDLYYICTVRCPVLVLDAAVHIHAQCLPVISLYERALNDKKFSRLVV